MSAAEIAYYSMFFNVSVLMAIIISPLILIVGALIFWEEKKIVQEIKVLENEHDH